MYRKVKNFAAHYEGAMEPFKIIGNTYFVGTYPASSHLIDTGEGLILIDTGYSDTLFLLINSIYKLGFNPYDIKYIINTHWHGDHTEATAALSHLTGAKTFIGEADGDYANGKVDLTWAKELGTEYGEAFEPDVLLKDGDIISLGNTRIRCVSTPGHTPGTMSFFFNVFYNGKEYIAGMHGGVGTNTMQNGFLEKYNLPKTCREEFLEGLNKVRNEKVEIFVGNHVWNNATREKAEQITDDFNPFINEKEWIPFIDDCIEKVKKLMVEEP